MCGIFSTHYAHDYPQNKKRFLLLLGNTEQLGNLPYITFSSSNKARLINHVMISGFPNTRSCMIIFCLCRARVTEHKSQEITKSLRQIYLTSTKLKFHRCNPSGLRSSDRSSSLLTVLTKNKH